MKERLKIHLPIWGKFFFLHNLLSFASLFVSIAIIRSNEAFYFNFAYFLLFDFFLTFVLYSLIPFLFFSHFFKVLLPSNLTLKCQPVYFASFIHVSTSLATIAVGFLFLFYLFSLDGDGNRIPLGSWPQYALLALLCCRFLVLILGVLFWKISIKAVSIEETRGELLYLKEKERTTYGETLKIWIFDHFLLSVGALLLLLCQELLSNFYLLLDGGLGLIFWVALPILTIFFKDCYLLSPIVRKIFWLVAVFGFLGLEVYSTSMLLIDYFETYDLYLLFEIFPFLLRIFYLIFGIYHFRDFVDSQNDDIFISGSLNSTPHSISSNGTPTLFSRKIEEESSPLLSSYSHSHSKTKAYSSQNITLEFEGKNSFLTLSSHPKSFPALVSLIQENLQITKEIDLEYYNETISEYVPFNDSQQSITKLQKIRVSLRPSPWYFFSPEAMSGWKLKGDKSDMYYTFILKDPKKKKIKTNQISLQFFSLLSIFEIDQMDIQKAYAIYSPTLYSNFETYQKYLSSRQKSSPQMFLQTNWKETVDHYQREKFLEFLQSHTLRFNWNENRKIQITPMIRRVNENQIGKIAQSGFHIENGNLGKGYYFASSVSTAEHLYKRKLNSSQENQDPQERILILSYVIHGNVFPVMEDSFKGKGCQKGYQSHFALVDDSGLPLTQEIGDVEMCKDELVLFEPAQILPSFVIHL